MSNYIYHFSASIEHDGKINHLDGIIIREVPMLSARHYRQLKTDILDEFNIVAPSQTLTINSLSFLPGGPK